MWYSKYNSYSINGLEQTVKVSVLFYNDVNTETFAEVFDVMPETLDSQDFQDLIASKVDILNLKQSQIDVKMDTAVLVDKPIGAMPAFKEIIPVDFPPVKPLNP